MRAAVITFAVFLILLVWGVDIYVSDFYNQRTLSCTVTGKDRGYDHESNSSKYRIYTSNCGTFKNEDVFFRGKFDSADVQGKLETGKTYKITVVGPRVSFFSSFPNVLAVDSAG